MSPSAKVPRARARARAKARAKEGEGECDPSALNTNAAKAAEGASQSDWTFSGALNGSYANASVIGRCTGLWADETATSGWIGKPSACTVLGGSERVFFKRTVTVTTGSLRFNLNADDFVDEIYVDGVAQGIASAGGAFRSFQTMAVDLTLSNGSHEIVVETRQGTGGAPGGLLVTSTCP